MNREKIRKLAKIELARRDFFTYCNLMAPDFYKKDRAFLVDLCNTLQDFYYSDDTILLVNMPPRHGKSRSLGLFCSYILGRNINAKIMTGSYNETLSTVFSKNVRNTIMEEKADVDSVVYSDIFPNTKIKYGDGSMNLWSLEGGYNNYLATSPGGTATGFGASILLIDDLIKNAYEGLNDKILNEHWEWFTNTMLSRLEEGGKIIIVMTRWNSNDLAGRCERHYKAEGIKVRQVLYKAYDNGKMLCEEILSEKSYKSKVRAMGEDIAEANYNQTPLDLKGGLFGDFKEYTDLPRDDEGNIIYEEILAFTDTADTGTDSCVTVIALFYERKAYILDVYGSRESMEITERETAFTLHNSKIPVYTVNVESNNGGRGFGRNVERILKEEFNNTSITFNYKAQSKNKRTRILVNSSGVMSNIYMPVGYKNKWEELNLEFKRYTREKGGAHDDYIDVITSINEYIEENNMETSIRYI